MSFESPWNFLPLLRVPGMAINQSSASTMNILWFVQSGNAHVAYKVPQQVADKVG